MNTRLSHAQVNVDAANLPFYKELTTLLGWQALTESEHMLGVAGDNGVSLWFIGGAQAADNNYDGPGVNHLGVAVDSAADVDAVARHIQQAGVPALFETPRHRPDFAASDTDTYYQVMFESPDGVLFEIVYTGPK